QRFGAVQSDHQSIDARWAYHLINGRNKRGLRRVEIDLERAAWGACAGPFHAPSVVVAIRANAKSPQPRAARQVSLAHQEVPNRILGRRVAPRRIRNVSLLARQ